MPEYVEHVLLTDNQKRIVSKLVKRGDALFAEPYDRCSFSGIERADDFLNDLENSSHFYVLACCMQRQISAARAWTIPYYVSLEIGCCDFSAFLNPSQEDFRRIFRDKNLTGLITSWPVFFILP